MDKNNRNTENFLQPHVLQFPPYLCLFSLIQHSKKSQIHSLSLLPHLLLLILKLWKICLLFPPLLSLLWIRASVRSLLVVAGLLQLSSLIGSLALPDMGVGCWPYRFSWGSLPWDLSSSVSFTWSVLQAIGHLCSSLELSPQSLMLWGGGGLAYLSLRALTHSKP